MDHPINFLRIEAKNASVHKAGLERFEKLVNAVPEKEQDQIIAELGAAKKAGCTRSSLLLTAFQVALTALATETFSRARRPTG